MRRGPRAEPHDDIPERYRAAVEVALQMIDAQVGDEYRDVIAFHAFGGADDSHSSSQIDDRCHDGERRARFERIHDEGFVDLDFRERHVLQRFQRRMTGTQIVDRQFESFQAKPRQYVDDRAAVAHRNAFRNLQRQRGGRGAGLCDEVGQAIGKIQRPQIHAGNIYRDRYGTAVVPEAKVLFERRLDHEESEPVDDGGVALALFATLSTTDDVVLL